VVLVEFQPELDGLVALLFSDQHLAAKIGDRVIALAVVLGGELVPDVDPGAQLFATLRALDVQVKGSFGAGGRGGKDFAQTFKEGHEDILA